MRDNVDTPAVLQTCPFRESNHGMLGDVPLPDVDEWRPDPQMKFCIFHSAQQHKVHQWSLPASLCLAGAAEAVPTASKPDMRDCC